MKAYLLSRTVIFEDGKISTEPLAVFVDEAEARKALNTCLEVGPYPVQKYYSIDKIELHEKKSAELESKDLEPDDYAEYE